MIEATVSTPTLPPIAMEERPAEYVADIGFDDLNLSPAVRRALAERGYTQPTPVQARAFPPAREGKDLIVRSKTGTGKTTAFGLPIIEQIPEGTREVKALILCPTRELALQVYEELSSLAKYRDIAVTAIYGGASMKQQEDALRAGAAIIVGTPGRVYDHIRRGNLKLERCAHAVLDEADEMLNQGFYEEVTRILDCIPKERQILLFSATVPDDIERLIAKYATNAETLLLSGDVYTVEHIRHIRYELSDAYPKPRNLLYILELENPDNAIVFCNTRDDTELVTAVLNRNGFDAELLNGDLPQKERERVMGRVKRGELAFMVATDIAARGIDISDLGHVINYSLPEDPAVYLHRVGRTGRIGKKGVALNLTSGRELATLTALERKYGVQFERRQMPTAEEATTMWTERHVRELKDAALGSIYEGFLGLAEQLKTRPDANELIAFMLRYFFSHRRMERVQTHGHESGKAPPTSQSRGEKPAREGKRESRSKHDDKERRPRREDRSRRDRSAKPSETLPVPDATPSNTASSETVERVETKFARPTRRPIDAPRQLSDRELFELLQSGQPLPPIDDPTRSGPIQSADALPQVTSGEALTPESDASAESPKRSPRQRRERRPKDEASESVAEGLARLWINLGKIDGVETETLPKALEALGAPSDRIAKVELRGSYSYVHVADADVATFEALGGAMHNGEKALKIERARK